MADSLIIPGFPNPGDSLLFEEKNSNGIRQSRLATVVASVWLNLEEKLGLVLLLVPSYPFWLNGGYYRVGQVIRNNEFALWEPILDSFTAHYNINNAVEDFAANGGDI
jgi:hypothetical protein